MTPKINTDYWPKPIPDRRFDWEAYPEDWDLGMPVGRGATEPEAILDLQMQLEDDND
jgi:hypothetical protein